MILSAGTTDNKTFERNANRFLNKDADVLDENYVEGQNAAIIFGFERGPPELHNFPGLRVKCNGQSCSLILTQKNKGRIYTKDKQDVEVLLQGESLKAESELGIQVIPYESTQEELFQLRLAAELSYIFAPYYRNLAEDMPLNKQKLMI